MININKKTIDNIINSRYLHGLIIFGAAVLYGILCFGETIWLDEAITANFVRLSVKDLVQRTAADVHPPLYYLIVKGTVSVFGDHIYVMKLASMIPFLAMLFLSYKKIRLLFGERTSFLFSAFSCVLSCVIAKNAEMRMYQWAMFFVVAFGVYLYEAVKHNKRQSWFAATLFGICAAYTQYYALITVAILYVLVFLFAVNISGKRRNIVICCLLSGILYLPWLLVLFSQLLTLEETGWWNEVTVTIQYVMHFIAYPVENANVIIKLVYCIVLVCGLVCACRRWKRDRERIALLYMLTFLTLILTGVLITMFYSPVFISRFLYPSVGLLLLGLCIALDKSNTWMVLFVALIALFFGAKEYNSELHYQHNENSIPKLTNFLETHREENAIYIYDDGAISWFMDYYAPESRSVSMDYFIQEKMDIAAYEKCYFLTLQPKEQALERMKELVTINAFFREHVEIRYHSFDIYEIILQ